MKLVVRPATVKDVEQVMALEREFNDFEEKLAKGELKDYEEAYDESLLSEIKKSLEKALKAKDKRVLVAVYRNKLIGFAVGRLFPDKPWRKTVRRRGYINKMFVTEKHRGKGVALKLRDSLYEWFAEKKCSHVELDVTYNNRQAVSIYKKWGFKPYSMDMRKRL